MGPISTDLIEILQYLFPGFITLALFYNLTSYSKPSNFEKVVQALIFTLFIQALEPISKYLGIEQHDDSASLIFSIVTAIILGLVFSFFVNNDWIHKMLRCIRITRETSFPSEWFGSFLNNQTSVMLHFHDERRLFGWPTEWPSEPEKGHFLINTPYWIYENGDIKRIAGVSNILVNVKSVKWVEFFEQRKEKENG